MIDLRNIAQQLRLPADQLRLAADLLEQGYQPAFIARYRADETGHLPSGVLWAIKFAMEREHQLGAARHEAMTHLGEGVELDEEATQKVERAQSIVGIDVAVRCFRARRAGRQSGERSGQASQLLEKMIAATAPIDNLPAWAAEQMAVDAAQSESLLQQAAKLVGSLLAGDTRLFERMRQTIQKKASVRIEAQPEPSAKSKNDKDGGASASDAAEHDADAEGWAHDDDDMVGDEAGHHEEAVAEAPSAPAPEASAEASAEPTSEVASSDVVSEATDTPVVSGAEAGSTEAATTDATSAEPPINLSFEGKKNREAKLAGGKRKGGDKAKAQAKLTPRQRRRRWLGSVLQPLRSLKKPIQRLTSYQLLMIGRGQRSQLIKVDLDYDRRQLVNMARDVFIPDNHPLSKWFAEACEQALSAGLFAKAESDAIAEEDELAQQKLLEAATDGLRAALLQRPVRGHRILVVDTVGPNSACIAIIDARGKCLATQEVVCSSQPSVVSQNVIMLGELVHKHKVTLVAISNGPARRFLIHTVAELMKQSASSNLRWTMVDRGGAEAYATSRHASVELPQLNRRFRAAVWLGRRLQDPLGELLKLDTTRLRLGSYQRELPQEPLKRLVTATLSDCLCVKGVDARYASEQQFSYVPGVSPEIATKLGEMAAKREFVSREALLAAITDWSETGKRQALGFLRIYQSPQTLDGTLIHPDDYHLAQRLIDATELTAPPAAPEGWLPPKIKVPKPPKNAAQPAGEAAAAFGEGLTASPEATAADAPAEPTETGVTAEAAPEAAPEPQEAPANVAAEAPPAAEATAEGAEATAGDAPAGDAPVGDAPAEQTTVQTEEPHAAAIAPEYSEDVVAEQASAPAIDTEKLAKGWQVGRAKLTWLANCLAKPFSDTRDRRPPVPMLTSVPTLADLQPGMSVYAIVVGVAEFGAFVELGPDCGGLIHISRLSSRYVEDPHQAVQIGDLVQAWVVSVDADKKRVALTALSPEQQRRQAEAQREEETRRHESRPDNRRGQGQGAPQGGGQQRGGQDRSGAGRPGQGQGGQGQGGYGGQGQRGGQGQGGRPQGAGAGGGGGRGPRNDRGGAPSGGRSRGGNAGGGRRDGGDSRPVIVKSKKPAAPITDAMKKGQEPLRSFSDLLQFYEVKRSDAPGTVTPGTVTPQSEQAAPPPEPAPAPPTVDNSADQPPNE